MSTYVIAKCAMSLDGYIDDATHERLVLSSKEDRDAVTQLRATCDAILIGAGTLRADNPSLGLRGDDLQRRRVDAGLPAEPAKIVITTTGELPIDGRFFTTGTGRPIVIAGAGINEKNAAAIRSVAELHILPSPDCTPAIILNLLSTLGIGRLLVEGGTSILTQFIASNAVDELRVAVAPFFVGNAAAPRAFAPARYPHDPTNRMQLVSVQMLGDMAALSYCNMRSR